MLLATTVYYGNGLYKEAARFIESLEGVHVPRGMTMRREEGELVAQRTLSVSWVLVLDVRKLKQRSRQP